MKFVRIIVKGIPVSRWINSEEKEKFKSLLERHINQPGVELEYRKIKNRENEVKTPINRGKISEKFVTNIYGEIIGGITTDIHLLGNRES